MPCADLDERRKYQREYMRVYRVLNRERVLVQQRASRERRREAIRATAREHDRNSPRRKLQKRLSLHAYRIRHGNPVRHLSPGTEAFEYAAIILGDPCVYCGEPSTEIDHIVPVSQGGTSEWDNLAPACTTCNRSKQAKSLIVFLSRRAGLIHGKKA